MHHAPHTSTRTRCVKHTSTACHNTDLRQHNTAQPQHSTPQHTNTTALLTQRYGGYTLMMYCHTLWQDLLGRQGRYTSLVISLTLMPLPCHTVCVQHQPITKRRTILGQGRWGSVGREYMLYSVTVSLAQHQQLQQATGANNRQCGQGRWVSVVFAYEAVIDVTGGRWECLRA